MRLFRGPLRLTLPAQYWEACHVYSSRPAHPLYSCAECGRLPPPTTWNLQWQRAQLRTQRSIDDLSFSSNSGVNLNDQQHFPPLPTKIYHASARVHNRSVATASLSYRTDAHTAQEPTCSSSAVIYNNGFTTVPAPPYGLRTGVHLLKLWDQRGVRRQDWVCTCGYDNLSSALSVEWAVQKSSRVYFSEYHSPIQT